MNNFESIEKTRRSFESGFIEGNYYDRQTQDNSQLKVIMSFINCGESILDLGTKTLERNRQKEKVQGLANLNFVCYDGNAFPFAKQSFDAVVTRYALHHFPDIHETFSEISRVY